MSVKSRVPFIHLRVHSAYSLSEGALKVPQLAELAVAHDMPALAITDTNNLFGALEFSVTMAKAGVQPIIGCSLRTAFADDVSKGDASAGGRSGAGAESGGHQHARPPFLALLAMDETGYRHLMRLSSKAYLEGARFGEPHVTLDDIARWHEGLICLTGGPDGVIDTLLAAGQPAQAEARLARLAEIFGDRLYVELQRHGTESEQAVEPQLVRLAYDMDLPLVATNACYFATPEDYEAHDVLLCIAEGVTLAEEDRRRVTPEHWFKPPAMMAELFADLPEAVENTVEIARRCHWRPTPRKPILPHFSTADGEQVADEAEELRRQAREGLKRRLAQHGPWEGYTEKDYEERLEYELDVIIRMGFPGYFLIVSDFIKWAKAQGIPVGPGRGSGAGSLVAYALTITDLDPLRFKLLFERFLNPERVSMPDFDIDFCQDRREEVIAYVQRKYGEENVAQIITFGKLQARAVCRDVGRVLQMPYGQVDRLTKMIPSGPGQNISLKAAIEAEPRLQEAAREEEVVARMLQIGQKLEGLYRHASTHAAGVVIGDRPLVELVPLYRDPRSPLPVTQFNMKWVEQAGLVKFDFLGLKTLTVIQTAVELIRRKIPDFDIRDIGFADRKTYDMLARGETVGVFQLESQGMRDVLRRMEADCIEDIIAIVALYRPGPMENIPKYCNVKKGLEEPDYLHPKLEPILKETYGIIVYQEQVMQIAQVLSGYSLGEADLLRRAMGKKIKEEMDRQKARFVEGAVARGIERAQAETIFDLVAKFASYGFNKSHAACYAIVAWQTAWLKANHPVEFLAASMTYDMGNTDKLSQFAREAARLGIEIVTPDVNRTQVRFMVEDGRIIYTLSALKNVGQAAIEHLVAVREKGGPFRSLADFARRIDPHIINRRALEAMARAGAFDSLNPNRAQVLAAVDAMLELAQRAKEERETGQESLFALASAEKETATEELPLPDVSPWPGMRKLEEEYAAVGFYLSGHPLDDYMETLTRIGVMPYARFREKVLREGQFAARLAGCVTTKRERRAKSGNMFAFVGLSDPSGQYEVVCFAELLNAARELLEPGQAVVVSVEGVREGEEVRLRLSGVESLEEKAARIAAGLRIFVEDDRAIRQFPALLKNGGRAPVQVVVKTADGGEVDILLGERFSVSPQVKGALKALPGVIDVQEL